ncbi:MAG: LytTR family transcriptional regulator [Flavobacteriales bacterium]|nr:LytTR family transcriptional regulator [Flavobacteriales bacterium]
MSIYYGSAHFLYTGWYGYASFEDVKEGCLLLIEAMQKMKCYDIIHDDRKIKGTWSHSLQWLEEVFMPKMIETGLNKMAHIYSEDIAAQYSMDRMLESEWNDKMAIFSEFEPASEWLLGNALNPPIPSKLFKSDKADKRLPNVLDEIYFISRHGNKSVLYLKDEEIESTRSLNELMSMLPLSGFMRVHRGCIVNFKKVSELRYRAGGHYDAYFKDYGGIFVPVSRMKVSALKDAMNLKESKDVEV